jgi:hypothetical protein
MIAAKSTTVPAALRMSQLYTAGYRVSSGTMGRIRMTRLCRSGHSIGIVAF